MVQVERNKTLMGITEEFSLVMVEMDTAQLKAMEGTAEVVGCLVVMEGTVVMAESERMGAMEAMVELSLTSVMEATVETVGLER
jgi:hypothetical protein